MDDTRQPIQPYNPHLKPLRQQQLLKKKIKKFANEYNSKRISWKYQQKQILVINQILFII
jgi:hypothetical protein